MSRPAMRLLYARASSLHRSPAVEDAQAQRKGNSQGDRWQYLPVHGLSEYFKGCSSRCRRNGEALSHGDQIWRRLHGAEKTRSRLRLSGGPESVLPFASGLSEHGDPRRKEFSGEVERGYFAYSGNGGGQNVAGGNGMAEACRLRGEWGCAGRIGHAAS